MKKAVLILLSAVVLLYSSCTGIGNLATVTDAGGILGLTSYQILTAIVGAANINSRGLTPPPLMLNGADGGSATYAYTLSTNWYGGDVAFAAFTVEDPDANIFTIDGTIHMEVDTASGIEVTFLGSVTVAKNGSAAAAFSVDVVISLTDDLGPPLTITIDLTGQLNGATVNNTTVYTFE
jgi:hypothetical protein